MKVIFAKNIGFCWGARRAIRITKNSLKNDEKPICFFGNLLHNERVVEKFKRGGIKFIKDLKEAKSGTLILPPHGFPPLPLKIKEKLAIRDTTCPLVKKVHKMANDFHKDGWQVIIIGDKNHTETKGIKGHANNRTIVVENETQAKRLPNFKKIGVVAQTTQSLKRFNRIVRILKNKTRKLSSSNTLCPEVSARQGELNSISKKADGILVIGSRSSANTKRLAELAKGLKKQVFWVNSLEELKKQNFKNVSVLGVVTGTSTPDWEIKKIRKWLNAKQK